MDLQQWREVQERVTAVQKLAVELLDMGHAREGVELARAATKVLRIKPALPAPVKKAPAKKPAGKGA